MAAAVLTSKVNASIPDPFHMPPQKGVDISPSRAPAASSSRLQPSTSQLSAPPHSDPPPKSFKRLLEQSIRTATKTKAKLPVSVTEDGTITTRSPSKGKEKAFDEQTKEKPRSRMLSKVSFRRPGGKDAVSSTPVPPIPAGRKEVVTVERDRDKDKVREAGFTSFLTPSLRQASMSSPTLHLSSQPFPSPYSQPFALPSSSSSNVAALVSPSRDRSRRTNGQPPTTRDISGPQPLSPKRDFRGSAGSPTPGTPEPKSSRPRPPHLTLSPSPSLVSERSSIERSTNDSPAPGTPSRRLREQTRSPDLYPPSPSPRSGYLASKRAAASASHLPLGSPPVSPTFARSDTPTRARSPSRTPTARVGPSSSSQHLPLTSSPSTATARRPSVDSPRRPSIEVKRPSIDGPRRPSVEARRPSLDKPSSPSPSRAASPTTPIRTRAISPTQRNLSPSISQTRFMNASTTSLASPSATPDQRMLIRDASSILIRELVKPPQLRTSSLGRVEWEEVENRLQKLARLERVWGKNGSGMSSSTQLGVSNPQLSSSGEARELALFSEALRDGYVLCQFINKLNPGTISSVDRKADGTVNPQNVTRFLASCRSLGVPANDLFYRDDLQQATAECLARVAKTVLSVNSRCQSPTVDKSKVIQGGQLQRGPSGPYSQGTSSRAAASTPNLSIAQRSTTPTLSSPNGRRRLSPPQPSLPPVRSDSPNESENSSGARTACKTAIDADLDEVHPIPPPKSPLRSRPSVDIRVSIADSTRANMGDSVRGSLAESFAPSTQVRQSLASTQVTDTSGFSSLLDRSYSQIQSQKFGTIRTVTTEATSLSPSDTPSLSRSDSISIPASPTEETARKWGLDHPIKPFRERERRPSETAIVDLSRVEEADESGSSANGKIAQPEVERPKLVRLGKGKWPDDFIGAFHAQKNSPTVEDEEDSPSSLSPSPISASPPRKRPLIGAMMNEGLEPLPQFPRRPTHRARHSVDTPGLLPKDALFRRDSSPGDASPTRRVMLRRNSTKTGPHRNGVYIPRTSDDPRTSEDDLVPFPRTVSAEHSTPPTSNGVQFPNRVADAEHISATNLDPSDRPRQYRGRFQSEIDGASSRRKPRPNSYDDLGAKPHRTRFESMVNLGGASSNASASDLLHRDSYDGSAVRQTLIVKDDGKPATQFQLGNCIGRGQFGAVYRALNLNTGQMVAVKRIRLEGLKEDEISQLMREVDLVKSLSHPSIVKYEGMARDDNTLSIVLELAENGSLGQTLKAFGKLNERLVAGYVVKILEGLDYLHQSQVVHCDLKAANILTTKNGNVKLSDFGVSLNLRAMEREKEVAGTPNWMAPEVIELKGASTKSDIWSLACTIVELLTGRPPYGDIANSMTVMFRIVEDDMPPLPDDCSDSLRDFLTKCFQKDPSKRPDALTLSEHDWLKQIWEPISKDLRYQDSIPFFRRVSADIQKSDAMRLFVQMDIPDSEKSTPDSRPRLDSFMSGSPSRPRPSMDPDSVSISPRDHSFVKTSFGRPVVCKVCLHSVKKSAVLCELCSLIAHSNPQEFLTAVQAGAPTSPTTDGGYSSRPSLDLPPSTPIAISPSGQHPPTAFKVFAAFKRSRSSLNTNESEVTSASAPSSSALSNTRPVSHKRSILKRNPTSKDRPSSVASGSTNANSSLRSTTTTVESVSTRRETVRQSAISITETHGSYADRSDLRLSHMTSFTGVSVAGTERDERESVVIPGDMPRDHRRRGDSKSGNCVVQ
ncbi:hypothetical protein ABKN59_007801 [Abortiporus biennis]